MADTDYLTKSSNADEQIVPAYRFLLRVEGFQDVPLKAIRPFSRECEFETIAEGGLNDYIRSVRKQPTKPFTLVVERYVNQKFIDPLANGTNFVLPLLLFCGNADAQGFDGTSATRVYAFTGCTVKDKEVSGFDSEKSALLTETVTIIYENSYAVNLPWAAAKDRWQFTKGNLKAKYADRGINIAQNNMRLNAAEGQESFSSKAAAKLWKFDKPTTKGDKPKVQGIGVQSASKDTLSTPKVNGDKAYTDEFKKKVADSAWWLDITNEDSKSYADDDKASTPEVYDIFTLEKIKAKTWAFDKKAKEGNGKQSADKDEVSKPQEYDQDTIDAIKAKTWAFDNTNKKGNDKQNAAADNASKPQEYDRKTLKKIKKKTWAFDGKEEKGNGKRSATKDKASRPKNYNEKTLDEIKGNTWAFDNTDKKGNDKQSATKDKASKPESYAEKMTTIKENTWAFDNTNKKGNDKQSAAKDVKSAPDTVASAISISNGHRWNFGKSKKDFLGTGTRHALELSHFAPERVTAAGKRGKTK